MGKKALSIQTSALEFDSHFTGLGVFPIPDSFWGLRVALADRDTCETDTSLLQLLPYMTLVRAGRYFVYGRGGKGDEGRLHGMLSIGIGGHVDRAPLWGESLMSLLIEEAAREYKEETGVCLKDLPTFNQMIVDRTNDVGRVHLGLHSIVQVSRDEKFTLEEGVIEKGQWLTISEMLQPEVYDRMENWSKALLRTPLRSQF